jgi:hypothetical protein
VHQAKADSQSVTRGEGMTPLVMEQVPQRDYINALERKIEDLKTALWDQWVAAHSSRCSQLGPEIPHDCLWPSPAELLQISANEA